MKVVSGSLCMSVYAVTGSDGPRVLVEISGNTVSLQLAELETMVDALRHDVQTRLGTKRVATR